MAVWPHSIVGCFTCVLRQIKGGKEEKEWCSPLALKPGLAHSTLFPTLLKILHTYAFTCIPRHLQITFKFICIERFLSSQGQYFFKSSKHNKNDCASVWSFPFVPQPPQGNIKVISLESLYLYIDQKHPRLKYCMWYFGTSS